MLSAAELTAMRAVESSAMPGTAYVVRSTLADDGIGGKTETWGTVGTVVCDLWQVNSRGMSEALTGGQIISRGDWYITVPYDTVVTAKDRFEVGGRTFEITFVPNGHSFNTALRIEARLFNEEKRR